MTTIETISLFYQSGSSDKEYHVDLVEEASLFRVDFRYGRRGSTLRSGTKCKNGPIDYAQAKKLYDKVVSEQLRDGYQPGEQGAAFQTAPTVATSTGIVPQLLNPIAKEDATFYLNNDDWIMQEKYDGHRRLIQSQKNNVVGLNRKGIEVALPQELVDIVSSAADQILLDGELMGLQFIAFDLLELNGVDLRNMDSSKRLEKLEEVRPKLEISPNFKVIKTAFTNKEKAAEFNRIKDADFEGVVFKLRSSPYVAGRPASGGDQVKYKFYETASFVIQKVSKTKSSVSLSLFDENNEVVPMGNVTVHANQSMPVVGEVWEVRYLYAFTDGALCQPNLLVKRDDIDVKNCGVSQLKYSGSKPAVKKTKATL